MSMMESIIYPRHSDTCIITKSCDVDNYRERFPILSSYTPDNSFQTMSQFVR